MVSSFLLTPLTTISLGIGGTIKHIPEDFIVGEITENLEVLDPRNEVFELEGKTGLFVHLVLIKNDIDTSDALDYLSKIWKIPRDNISFAGSKDKKAFTAQRVSVWGIKDKFEKNKIKEINLPKIKTKSLCLRIKELRLGNLWGNFFEIIIRDISLDESEVRTRLLETFNEIEDNGMILNGYGQQRFGDTRPITHWVGEKLLLGDCKEAIKEYIGRAFKGESKEVRQSRKIYWETEDIEETIKLLPNHLKIERKLLIDLQKTNNDYKQVIFNLPIQFRKLFIHAYQSYLFNKYLTKRYFEYNNNLAEPIKGEKIIHDEVFAPIIGSKIELTGDVKEIYEKILEEEPISFGDFLKPLSQKLGSTGSFRPIRMIPEKLSLIETSKDLLNEGKSIARISFELKKGSYATELLKEIIK